MSDPWNANIHYDARVDDCIPSSTKSVLDVGCGDGFLAARLAPRVPRVVALDVAVLALLMARKTNCLILDEPTNHLDVDAIEQLEQALESFDGTVILVTHDRRMIDTVRITRTIDLG